MEHRPLTYTEAKQMVIDDLVDDLKRSTQQWTIYRKWLQETTQVYRSAGDFIQHKVFGMPIVQNSESKLLEVEPLPQASGNGHHMDLRVILRLNDFPYHFSDDTVHYCLWANRELEREEIETYLSVSLPHREYCWFINRPAKKSIKLLWHIHV
eukprot:Partr_v1_DN26527_c3_g2_i2_m3514